MLADMMKRLLVCALAGPAISLVAQSEQPAATPAPPAQPPTAQPRVDSEALNYLYNRGPADGSALGVAGDDYRKGKAAAGDKQNALESLVSSQSILAPDFEKFLSAQEADPGQIAKYESLYDGVLKFLNARKPVEAWQILFAMSEFPWDAGISKQIANRVRAVWDTDGTAKALLEENDKLQSKIRTSNWNADLSAESARRNTESRTKGKDGQQAVAAALADSAKSSPGALRLTEEYFKSLDSKARIKLNEIKVENIKSKARTDLVEYITTLFKSKRYAHAVLAAEFYQALFADGELPPEVANQATASLEATREIARAVDVFRFKVKNKQVGTASTILEKAWETGDTTPQMNGLERELKLAVIEHANRVRKMKNLIEARDLDGLETVLNEMEVAAVDFDTTKPRSLVQAIKLDSRMRLGKAKLLAQQGNTQKAMDEFKAAAELWPANPDLDKASSEYFSAEDASAKNIADFDREFAAGNHRGIADKQVQYLAFVQSDEKRKAQLKVSLEKVRGAETATEKAKILDGNGDSAGAWETIEIAVAGWPEDQQLNQALALYSSKAPEFVSAINKATSAEKAKKLGASMSLYALAKNRYPASQIASAGLKRVSDEVLKPTEEPSPTPAKAP